jgi:hypothetical protein
MAADPALERTELLDDPLSVALVAMLEALTAR